MSVQLPQAPAGLIRIAILAGHKASEKLVRPERAGTTAFPVPKRLVIEALLFDPHALVHEDDHALERLPEVIGKAALLLVGAEASALSQRLTGFDDAHLLRDVNMLSDFLWKQSNAQQAATYWLLDARRAMLICPDGRSIQLTGSEQAIVATALVDRGTEVTTRARLIHALGHEPWNYDERRLETLISRLRKKVARQTPHALIVRGVRAKGYMFSRIEALN